MALEKELIRYDVALCKKICLTLNSISLKDFINVFIQRYELEQLKVALRIWHKKIAANVDDYLLGERIAYAIDFKKIILCQNIEEVILLLDETPYKRPLLAAREKFKTRNSLFILEVEIDIDYYERLLACTGKFSPPDRRIARKLIGIEIDIENINWLIRLRKYYSLGIGDILDWVIPGGDKIDKERVRQFYTSDGLGTVIASVALGPYMRIKDLAEENAQLIESFLYEILFREVKRALAGFPFTIGTILGYLILKHRETKNLISLFYAKGFGLKKEEIASLLQLNA
jgi:V/A-type H+-transporting ATPase subunit C